MKNKGVKLPFVTKNSKDLVGTSVHDSSALIEFAPLSKTRISNYPLSLKSKNSSLYLQEHNNKNITIVTYTYLVNLKTVSSLNNLVSSKACPNN